MDLTDLIKEVRAKPIDKVVNEFMFEGDAICFRGDRTVINNLRYDLAKSFFMHPKAIEIVGSAKLGFSLNPKKVGKKYDKSSDIDIVLISEQLFDRAWLELLRMDLYEHYKLTEKEDMLITECYNNISNGFISPDKLPTTIPFSKKWWRIFAELSRNRDYEHKKIRGRLFKDWLFAEKYYTKALIELAKR